MPFRLSLGSAFVGALVIGPPAGVILTLLFEGQLNSPDADLYTLIFVFIGIAYVVTLIGLGVIGLPVVYVSDRLGGDAGIVAIGGLIAAVSLISALMADDIIRMIWLTLAIVVTIFVSIYLRQPQAAKDDQNA